MAAFDERDWVFRDRHPERADVYARYDRLGEIERARPGVLTNLEYGAHPRERFDLFPGQGFGAPLVVFFHGGYWQSLSKERFSFIGGALNAAGYSVAVLGYPLAPELSLPDIVKAADRGIDAAVKALATPPSTWIAAGHSAGGHLALCVAKTSRTVPLAGVAVLSPICDLEPLCGTSLDAALALTPQIVREFSPLRLPPPDAPIRMWVGDQETPGFLNQAITYARHVGDAGGDIRATVLDGLNHYTIPSEIIAIPSRIVDSLSELYGWSGFGS